MADVTLGKTQITVNKNGFGCLPVQRISKEEAARLLRKARENGIDFFDTARAYTDSEEKLGEAFGGNWEGFYWRPRRRQRRWRASGRTWRLPFRS